MPYQTNGKRDYKKELAWEHRHPQRVKQREERNQARRLFEKEGKVHKGDGLDVDHKVPLSKGGQQIASNFRAVTAHANRSFSRNPDGSLKSQISKKERERK